MHIPRITHITHITHACPGLGAVKIAEERRYWRPWLRLPALGERGLASSGPSSVSFGPGASAVDPGLAWRMQCNRSKNVQQAVGA